MTGWIISRDAATWIEKAHRFLQIQNYETNAEYVTKKQPWPKQSTEAIFFSAICYTHAN